MTKVKVGLVKEGKVPQDRRVPMIPEQCRQYMEAHPEVKIVAQSSDIRCYDDQEYREAGVEVVDKVDDCHVLLGVKEVPLEQLIENKTYLFFSHTIKMQEYNKELLRTIKEKHIRMIDYELLTDDHGIRLIAFGRYAGIVGAYNGVKTFGQRYNLFDLRPAHECIDLEDLRTEFTKVKLPNIKIALTGGGRVSRGSMEVLNGMGIRKVSAKEYLQKDYKEPVYCQLNSRDYHRKKNGEAFSRTDFYQNPGDYEGFFMDYANVTDLLIAGAFWDPNAPVLFRREEMIDNGFHIKVIADITCDIEGSIPSTKRPSTIEDPIYDYNPEEGAEAPALSEEANVTVMAVDNLPNELPRDASRDFGQELRDHILPQLIAFEEQPMIRRATITKNGHIQPDFQYLQDWLNS